MRTLVIGDVHGCVDELDDLVVRAAPDHVVLVGDLFTKGPDPVGVWERVRANRWPAVLGNHEVRLLRILDGKRKKDRQGRAVIDALDATGKKWRAWVRALPLFHEVAGWTVVHAGLHPNGRLEDTTREMATTMRRWPDDRPHHRHWHRQYRGARRVVFGHDAIGGYVRVEREGVPWLVGLDTGCVYGGHLSGYVVETDELFQVPAARVYHAI